MKHLFILVLLALSGPSAMSTTLKGAVYSPKAGIVCDKKAQFCADDRGISLAYTKEFLGPKAEATMLGRIKEAGGPVSYDMTWFGFSNGVDCKVKDRVCRVTKHSDQVDAAHTKALFGR